MIHRFAALGLLASAICAAPAMAQTDPMARTAAANELGVLEYCQGQGHVDQTAVTAQRATLARLPASAGAAPTDAAEALGKQGTISANGNTVTLAGFASSHNTTVDALCKQMASSVTQSAAALQSVPGMPAMPGGMPTMPVMPGGMPTMLAMPGVPAAPR